MTQWEYLVVYMNDSKVAESDPEMDRYLDADTYTDKLNKHGAAGWELMAFAWEQHGAKAVFKRVKVIHVEPDND
jgi:hypothetical protein